MSTDEQQNWIDYCRHELAILKPILESHGFSIDNDQPHLKGERFLQQAITTESGKKLILYGKNAAGDKVVIKATQDLGGKKELGRERSCRRLLNSIDFAAEAFRTPAELLWHEEGGFLISIQAFVEQPKTFLEHTLEEQFDLALNSFKAQEGAHATTYSHRRLIKSTYEIRNANTYLNNFSDFIHHVSLLLPLEITPHTQLDKALEELKAKQEIIEQYTGFLTHTDFVPHNIRIDANDQVYLLDHSSFTFGNKYEGWARFLNFMELYNPPLTKLLTDYVANNRSPEESVALRLMRLYRLGEIIFYYAKAAQKSAGDLKVLNETRIHFWATILEHLLQQTSVPATTITDYQTKRDSLRSDDEKERQIGLH